MKFIMKKRIFFRSWVVLWGVLLSCHENDTLNVTAGDHVLQTAKIVLDGIGVQDTLSLHYQAGKVASVDWCTQMYAQCITGYSELRQYDDAGNLASIDGRWRIVYEYQNGLRQKLTAYRDGQYYSTNTFLEYDGLHPKKVRVEQAAGEAEYVELEFDQNGDLVRKAVNDVHGNLLLDVRATYSPVKNALKGLMETPSYAVLFFGFDDFVFYYSEHIPEAVTIIDNNPNVVPREQVIHYEIERDATNKLLAAKAYRNGYNVHNIGIRYSNK